MKNFFKLMIGAVLPILGFLAFWWGSLPFVTDEKIWFFALAGLILGIAADIVFAKNIFNIYKIKLVYLILIYLFYTIGVFGFFMGAPLFNLFLGPISGAYMGLRFRELGLRPAKSTAHNIAHFSSDILFIICILSGYLALRDSSTAANLEGMFSLSFNLSYNMLWAIVIVGGIILVLLNYILARYFFRKAIGSSDF